MGHSEGRAVAVVGAPTNTLELISDFSLYSSKMATSWPQGKVFVQHQYLLIATVFIHNLIICTFVVQKAVLDGGRMCACSDTGSDKNYHQEGLYLA
ncbi:hypothetical protein GN956_G17962 [Arapaima gigas]